jgi:hypothetical protein
MEKIRELLGKPLVGIVLGFIVGMFFGWFVLGWMIAPVTWTDASTKELRSDLRTDYLKMAVDSYVKNQNSDLAMKRWTELGDKAPDALKALQSDSTVNQTELELFSRAVGSSSKSGPQGEATKKPAESKNTPAAGKPTDALEAMLTVTTTPAAASGGDNQPLGVNLIYLLIVFCVLTLVIGAVLIFMIFIRPRMSASKAEQATEKVPLRDAEPGYDYSASEQGEPIAQFMTTYTLGDDLYDDSFSIDSPNGEFLGECGAGVSDTIGVGDPKKVSAFEVWLFDKNDIQTVTKVLMSEHAFNDPETNQKLTAKGEPVLVVPGKHIILETATLQMEARIVDTNYGQGALPPSSFFERITLELAVWPKTVNS